MKNQKESLQVAMDVLLEAGLDSLADVLRRASEQPASTVEKFFDEKGEVGVVYSSRSRVGWSSWYHGSEHTVEEMIFDKGLVEVVLLGSSKDVREYVADHFPDTYFSGQDLSVRFLPPGTCFEVVEDDGCESVKVVGGGKFQVA